MSYYYNGNANQPDGLEEILAKRPEGADIAPKAVENLRKRMQGAFLGRCAGCTLGVPVEGYSVMRMLAVAMETDTPFPPTTYWKGTDLPEVRHYGVNYRTDYLE